MNLIFLGPPGVGKGTIAKQIAREKGIPHISTGDLLRAAVKQGIEVGQKAKTYMDRGKLVPDDIVIGLLKERISKGDCKNGCVLDGFPRTIPQAEALESQVKVDKVLNFKAADKTLISRISGRRTCKKCNAIYHIKNIPPKVEGVCDKCGGKLFQRDDDKIEAVKKRLVVYKQKTEPLIGFYEKKGILVDIETKKPIHGIFKDSLTAIE